MEKQKVYARKNFQLGSPDWMTGVEGFHAGNGRLVMYVLLQDGSVELLSNLDVAERRGEEREYCSERLMKADS